MPITAAEVKETWWATCWLLKPLSQSDTQHFCPHFIGQRKLHGHSSIYQGENSCPCHWKGYPGIKIRIFDKLVTQSTIIDFANFSPACRECLYKESWQKMSGWGGKIIMMKSFKTPQGLERALFCSPSHPLNIAQCLEHARFSVNIYWL